MMKKAMLWAASVLMVAASMSWADPFVNPPCANWPTQWQLPTGQTIYNPWMTSFPYPRNIRYTFDNEATATLPVYEGWDDAALKGSDGIAGTSNWQFHADDAAFQRDGVARRFGLIGIDNRQGAQTEYGYIVFRIDNWDSPNEWKHVWKELVFFASPGVVEEENITVPAGFETLGPRTVISQTLADNYTVIDVAFKVWPNPPHEDLYIHVWVPAGGFLLVDEIHFATECVPEPATLALTAVAAGTLAALRRRRRPQS